MPKTAVLAQAICPAVPGRQQCVHGTSVYKGQDGSTYNGSEVYTCHSCEVQGKWNKEDEHICWSCGTDDGVVKKWTADGEAVKP